MADDEYVLDAHTLIWYVEDSPRLGAHAARILDDPTSTLYAPVIALAEACWTVERGRCNTPSVAALLQDLDADPRITVLPLDRAIFDMSLTLTTITEMHDRLIVATTLFRASRGASVSLLTCDHNITSSGLVPVIW